MEWNDVHIRLNAILVQQKSKKIAWNKICNVYNISVTIGEIGDHAIWLHSVGGRNSPRNEYLSEKSRTPKRKNLP